LKKVITHHYTRSKAQKPNVEIQANLEWLKGEGSKQNHT